MGPSVTLLPVISFEGSSLVLKNQTCSILFALQRFSRAAGDTSKGGRGGGGQIGFENKKKKIRKKYKGKIPIQVELGIEIVASTGEERPGADRIRVAVIHKKERTGGESKEKEQERSCHVQRGTRA